MYLFDLETSIDCPELFKVKGFSFAFKSVGCVRERTKKVQKEPTLPHLTFGTYENNFISIFSDPRRSYSNCTTSVPRVDGRSRKRKAAEEAPANPASTVTNRS